MNTFSSIGFDSNWGFGAQSVFTFVDKKWQVHIGPDLEMITEAGDLMVTEDDVYEMITE